MENQKFCALFTRAQQLADEGGLNPENTFLANEFCPFIQACLGLECQLYKQSVKNPPYRTLYLEQDPNQQPPSQREKFFNRLMKTVEINGCLDNFNALT